jgi:hypothetical protein
VSERDDFDRGRELLIRLADVGIPNDNRLDKCIKPAMKNKVTKEWEKSGKSDNKVTSLGEERRMRRNEGKEETGESLCHGASGKGLIILVDYRQLKLSKVRTVNRRSSVRDFYK